MPRLSIVPTPIGNLEDITLRALRVLREVSLILAEDTRHTRKLLSHYQITTPLLSYHQHNKRQRLERVLTVLEEQDVALVSSAGTPSISDPGFELIEAAIAAGVAVDVLPGPSAVVTAVVAAALPSPGFLFVGFLPRRAAERRQRLEQIAGLPYALVMYEAPHRLVTTLQDLLAILGDRDAVVARELTKVHQETVREKLSALLERYQSSEPKGEFTLVVGSALPPDQDRSHEALSELRRRYLAGESRTDAVPAVAQAYGLRRNEAYRLWLAVAQGDSAARVE